MRPARVPAWPLALAATLGPGCSTEDNLRMNDDTEQQVAQAGADFIARQYPDFDKTGKTLTVRDKDGQWLVTYKLPPGMLGGAPVVLLDKATLAVARSYRTQ